MRPVDRGEHPKEEDGSARIYTSYSNARRDLIDRMGQYCSYCNQKLPASLAVEHVQPKSLFPALELEWENFLLACTNCNSTKGNKPVDLNDYLWPDVHNTDLAFVYTQDGKVQVNTNLNSQLQQKAQNLLDLVGLEKYEDNYTASDRRWKNRKNTFSKVAESLKLFESALSKGAGEEFINVLGNYASDNGFFSIWLQIFTNYSQVRKKIIQSFVGTAANAFDINTNAISRTDEL